MKRFARTSSRAALLAAAAWLAVPLHASAQTNPIIISPPVRLQPNTQMQIDTLRSQQRRELYQGTQQIQRELDRNAVRNLQVDRQVQPPRLRCPAATYGSRLPTQC